ncbi:hypothetical protein F5Y14DRAFT_363499 [Nemania sp. NC0429]|nr:hypothetical protein F5Y14DRAFT_363499 [Nemania sp. NC0429]
MAATDTFYRFPDLPTEIRLQIWAMAAEGLRILHLYITDHFPWQAEPWRAYYSPTPPPALLHACRESREAAPYEKAFLSSPHDEARYIWVNFQNDRICLPNARIEELESYGAVIQLLGITVEPLDSFWSDSDYDAWAHFNEEVLEPFTALRELHISIPDTFLQWGMIALHAPFQPPGPENVRFVEPHTGLSLSVDQYVMAYHWSRDNGGKVENMDDIDRELASRGSGRCNFDLEDMAKID